MPRRASSSSSTRIVRMGVSVFALFIGRLPKRIWNSSITSVDLGVARHQLLAGEILERIALGSRRALAACRPLRGESQRHAQTGLGVRHGHLAPLRIEHAQPLAGIANADAASV